MLQSEGTILDVGEETNKTKLVNCILLRFPAFCCVVQLLGLTIDAF